MIALAFVCSNVWETFNVFNVSISSEIVGSFVYTSTTYSTTTFVKHMISRILCMQTEWALTQIQIVRFIEYILSRRRNSKRSTTLFASLRPRFTSFLTMASISYYRRLHQIFTISIRSVRPLTRSRARSLSRDIDLSKHGRAFLRDWQELSKNAKPCSFFIILKKAKICSPCEIMMRRMTSRSMIVSTTFSPPRCIQSIDICQSFTTCTFILELRAFVHFKHSMWKIRREIARTPTYEISFPTQCLSLTLKKSELCYFQTTDARRWWALLDGLRQDCRWATYWRWPF